MDREVDLALVPVLLNQLVLLVPQAVAQVAAQVVVLEVDRAVALLAVNLPALSEVELVVVLLAPNQQLHLVATARQEAVVGLVAELEDLQHQPLSPRKARPRVPRRRSSQGPPCVSRPLGNWLQLH